MRRNVLRAFNADPRHSGQWNAPLAILVVALLMATLLGTCSAQQQCRAQGGTLVRNVWGWPTCIASGEVRHG